jgi:hypothetical protein
MPVPAAKIKAICTESELALVRASRKPELEELTQAAVKRLAVRARKSFDKWQDLSRGQARTKTREVGAGSTDPNTLLKVQIFRDALTNFETKLAKFAGSDGAGAKQAQPKAKRARAAEHRATRATVRKDLAKVEAVLNRQKPKKKKKSR